MVSKKGWNEEEVLGCAKKKKISRKWLSRSDRIDCDDFLLRSTDPARAVVQLHQSEASHCFHRCVYDYYCLDLDPQLESSLSAVQATSRQSNTDVHCHSLAAFSQSEAALWSCPKRPCRSDGAIVSS